MSLGEDASTRGRLGEEERHPPRDRSLVPAFYALLPLVLLAVVVAVLVATDPFRSLRQGIPPIEDLSIERVQLTEAPRELVVTVVNGGAEPVTIAQVLVDEAFWPHEISPAPRIDPLRSAAIRVPYPWVEGEPLEVDVLTSTGLTFQHRVEVALATPQVGAASLGTLALLGAWVGVIPVAIGLLWFPVVRRLRPDVVGFVLAFAAGVLVFLAADATAEALEIAPRVPTAIDGPGIFLASVVVAIAVLLVVGGVVRRRGSTGSATSVALLIAVGIGLHNFGEGLAIAAAYTLGEVALTSLLVVGFALHNSTEGLAMVAPLSGSRARLGLIGALGLIAGGPTILGTWLGALVYSPTLAVVFLGLGVGAIVQVLWVIGGLVRQRAISGLSVVGIAAGVLVMYATGLVVAA